MEYGLAQAETCEQQKPFDLGLLYNTETVDCQTIYTTLFFTEPFKDEESYNGFNFNHLIITKQRGIMKAVLYIF